MTSSSDSVIMFAGAAPRTRETVDLLDHRFTVRGSKSGAARGKRCPGQVVWGGARGAQAPRGVPPPCISACASTQKLSEPRVFVHRPPARGPGVRSQASSHVAGSPGYQGALQKSPHSHSKTPLFLVPPQRLQEFWELGARNEAEDQIRVSC